MSQEEIKLRIEASLKLLEKIEKDLVEAYERTPAYFTVKPYVQRALRNLKNLKKIVEELDSFISSHEF
ncbi:MAG: hypothetical protein DRO23_03325 [Thermoprotei archaeon]|nr:MAG: hypothetical protein DRO23_03325 [Thermoprotei archaeon]